GRMIDQSLFHSSTLPPFHPSTPPFFHSSTLPTFHPLPFHRSARRLLSYVPFEQGAPIIQSLLHPLFKTILSWLIVDSAFGQIGLRHIAALIVMRILIPGALA